jgi:hypothetical protein
MTISGKYHSFRWSVCLSGINLGEGSEMSLCLGQRAFVGDRSVVPKPQDACAQPRKNDHGSAKEITATRQTAQYWAHGQRVR